MKRILAACLLGCLCITTQLWAQDEALQKLIQGKKYFWEAKFNDATSALRKVVGMKKVKTHHLFEGYLYLGFVLMRQKAPGTEITFAFEQAIKLKPKREVDASVIPPDLVARFNRVRDTLVGCTYLTSDPEGVEFVILYEDSILQSVSTPALICELTNRPYEVLVAEDGYQEKFFPLPMTAGKVDTLAVTLIPDETSGRGSKKLWTWFARGGIVATAAAVIYKTVLESKGENDLQDLPGPPDHRPSQAR